MKQKPNLATIFQYCHFFPHKFFIWSSSILFLLILWQVICTSFKLYASFRAQHFFAYFYICCQCFKFIICLSLLKQNCFNLIHGIKNVYTHMYSHMSIVCKYVHIYICIMYRCTSRLLKIKVTNKICMYACAYEKYYNKHMYVIKLIKKSSLNCKYSCHRVVLFWLRFNPLKIRLLPIWRGVIKLLILVERCWKCCF